MTEQLPSNMRLRTLGEYLTALSSGSPTPGGGSAAGLAGAFGCALGAMVCNLTIARQESQVLSDLANRFDEMASSLIELARQDEGVFASYRAAIALPRASDVEKAARRMAIERALVDAAEVPLQMVDTGIAAIDALRQVAEVGSIHALGDLLTGGHLLRAMALGALVNISSNAESMKVHGNRQRFEQAAAGRRQTLDASAANLQFAVASRSPSTSP